MFDYIRDVGMFQAKFGLDDVENAEPGFLKDRDLQRFRLGFLLEELLEYADSIGWMLDIKVEKGEGGALIPSLNWMPDPEGTTSLSKTLDALVDLQYVLSGTARFHGFAQHRYDGLLGQRMRVFDSAWFRVHRANMAKVRGTMETSKRGTKFDVVKPVGWKAPELEDLVT